MTNLEGHIRKKIGLLIDNQNIALTLEKLLKTLNYFVTTISSYDTLLIEYPTLEVLFIDEYFTDLFLEKFALDKNKDYYLPIVILLENEKKIEQWLHFDVSDFIHPSIDKTEILLCLKRQEHLKAIYDKMLPRTHIKHTKKHDLTHLAYHDALTGLNNRIIFENAVNMAIHSAERRNEKLAILFLDLDNFKNVNDTMGHQKGDLLLKAVSARILNSVRMTDTVARLGGDEFVILISGVTKIETVASIAQKIQDSFQKKFNISRHEFSITASMGVSVYPENGQDTQTLIRNADQAMYLAKDMGRNNFQFCTKDLSTRIQKRSNLERRLRKALQGDNLLLHYQPTVDIATGKITGVEALIRWEQEDGQLIYPVEFISLAEETELIVPIAEWVILRACEESKVWTSMGFSDLELAINLSIRNLLDKNIVMGVQAILDKTQFQPKKLSFEISENLFMKEIEGPTLVTDKLKNLGIRLGVDNFGLGPSSLTFLKRLKVDYIKIDRILIEKHNRSADDADIISAIIAMAHNLKIKIIAEGIEKKSELEFLIEKKCDEYQGNLFCPPIPLTELIKFLKTASQYNIK